MTGRMSRDKGAQFEEWRDVLIDGGAYIGRYQVSNFGNVRAHPESSIGGMKPSRVLFQGRDDRGYPQVYLYIAQKQKTVKVHRLVALAFMGQRENGMTINHIDGDKCNNSVENLEYVSVKENTRHALRVIRDGFCVIDEQRMSWTEAVEKFGAAGVTAKAARRRFIRLGWSVHRSITTPIQKTGRPFGGKVSA